MVKITKKAVLLYHSKGRSGKIEIIATKNIKTKCNNIY